MKTGPTTTLKAIHCLRELGYPMANIRKALHKLTGISQPDMARALDVSRLCITTHIGGTRSNPDIQEKIAALWGVPPEELFGQDLAAETGAVLRPVASACESECAA
jgi:DNA-binding XRE family transcriptional regulator